MLLRYHLPVVVRPLSSGDGGGRTPSPAVRVPGQRFAINDDEASTRGHVALPCLATLPQQRQLKFNLRPNVLLINNDSID